MYFKLTKTIYNSLIYKQQKHIIKKVLDLK